MNIQNRLDDEPIFARLPARFLRPRILVVVEPHRLGPAWWALSRVASIARRREADLYVLLVLPEGCRVGLVARAVRLLGRDHAMRRGRLMVRVGYPTVEATHAARALEAELVVVGAPTGTGGAFTRLSRRLRKPVLITRRPKTGRTIIGASDFTDERLPVLEHAIALGERADVANRRVLLIHNVDPEGRVFTRRFGGVLGERGIRQLRDRRAERLHALAARTEAPVHAVLSGNADAATAIAEHAARLGADLVVIGAHARGSSASQTRRQRTARRIVERVDASALVLPLAPAG